MLIKNIYKKYPNSSKLLEYKKAINISNSTCKNHNNFNCSICFPRKSVSIVNNSSIIRTKTNITDLCLCNKFDLFVTFTINPKKIDSYNYELVKKSLTNWLNYQQKQNKKFQYILVPELHKSGRIHFHALITNYTGKLIPTNKKSKNKKIYNLSNWNYGYSTAIRITGNSEKLAYYLQKYITKDLIKITNKKRYWRSKNLITPIIEYNKKVIEIMIPTYDNEYYVIYKSIPAEYTKSTK